MKTFADGYCEQCSRLSYPLTKALEKTGVPTGAENWQRSYGPNKVKALDDYHTALRRLLIAMDEEKPEDVQREKERAEFYLEFHARIARALTAQAQTEASVG